MSTSFTLFFLNIKKFEKEFSNKLQNELKQHNLNTSNCKFVKPDKVLNRTFIERLLNMYLWFITWLNSIGILYSYEYFAFMKQNLWSIRHLTFKQLRTTNIIHQNITLIILCSGKINETFLNLRKRCRLICLYLVLKLISFELKIFLNGFYLIWS